MRPPAPLPNGALSEILRRDLENGFDPFDDGGRPVRPPPGPPMTVAPLFPVALPKPDWRQELAAAERRDAAPEPDPEPPGPESLRSRPAKRRRKSATPNLDEVKRWRQENR